MSRSGKEDFLATLNLRLMVPGQGADRADEVDLGRLLLLVPVTWVADDLDR